ncbi:hypothetical protein [Peribacillus simplex]|uniref:hypothetical protein n=1 Tax=Peribacillus simplex TaxID=1478 RepID=UPI003D2E7194
MGDILFILIIAFAGVIIAIIGFIFILGRRILKPKKALQQRIDNLEEEVWKIKNQK